MSSLVEELVMCQECIRVAWLKSYVEWRSTNTSWHSSVTKHSWDMGMGYLWLNGWGINHLMGGAFMGIMT